jgi:hypothetical protein
MLRELLVLWGLVRHQPCLRLLPAACTTGKHASGTEGWALPLCDTRPAPPPPPPGFFK